MGYVIKVDGQLYLSRGTQFGTTLISIGLVENIDKARVWPRKCDVDTAAKKAEMVSRIKRDNINEIRRELGWVSVWGWEKITGSTFEIVDVTVKENT